MSILDGIIVPPEADPIVMARLADAARRVALPLSYVELLAQDDGAASAFAAAVDTGRSQPHVAAIDWDRLEDRLAQRDPFAPGHGPVVPPRLPAPPART